MNVAGTKLEFLIHFHSCLSVLVPGLPADGPVPHPGRILRSGPPPLPQQRLAAHSDEPLLLRGRDQRDSGLSLGLAQRRDELRCGAGEVWNAGVSLFSPPRASVNISTSVQLFLPRVIVMYLIAGAAFLFYVTKIPERYFPGESLCRCLDGLGRFPAAPAHWLGLLSPPRPAELPGRQPPGVARSGGGDVLLVASDRRAHHALQAQPSVHAADQQQQQLKAANQIKTFLQLLAAFVAANLKTESDCSCWRRPSLVYGCSYPNRYLSNSCHRL